MSSLSEKKREFRALLIDGGIIPAINALKECLFETSEKYRILLLIEGHFKQVRKREQSGIISYENLCLEENRSREKLLDLIDDLQEADYPLIDPRDGKKYKKIELAGRVWMAENLNFDVGEKEYKKIKMAWTNMTPDESYFNVVDGCWLYNDDSQNEKKCGRLYTWEAARKACPPGWRLPTRDEWHNLFDIYYDYKISGHQKADAALKDGGGSGLNVQVGGLRDRDGSFKYLGDRGFYWSATEAMSIQAYYFLFNSSNNEIPAQFGFKGLALSCRCVQGAPSNGND